MWFKFNEKKIFVIDGGENVCVAVLQFTANTFKINLKIFRMMLSNL